MRGPLGIPILVDERLGHDAIFLIDQPPPVFYSAAIGPWTTRKIGDAAQKVAIGSMQAWGALIAGHLAEAYRPEGVPR